MRFADAFAARPVGPGFALWRRRHLSALAVTSASLTGIVVLGRRLGPRGRRRVRTVLASALIGQEVSFHAWRAACGTWTPREMLPLHLCSVLVWGGAATLLHPTRLGDDVVWFWGLAGAPQALLTPDVGEYDFPHYRFVQFFVSHGLVLAVPLWRVFVEGRRPTAAGGRRAFVALLAHAGVVGAVNARLGSNYLFVNRKPETASVLDKLPPWSGYLPILAGVAAGVFWLVQAPFSRRGRASVAD